MFILSRYQYFGNTFIGTLIATVDPEHLIKGLFLDFSKEDEDTYTVIADATGGIVTHTLNNGESVNIKKNSNFVNLDFHYVVFVSMFMFK